MMLFSTGTGLEPVRVAGPDPGYRLVGDAGYWVVGAGVGLLLRRWTADSGAAHLCKNKEEGGRRGFCQWPLRCLSQSLSKRKRKYAWGGGIYLVWRCDLVFIVDVQPVGR